MGGWEAGKPGALNLTDAIHRLRFRNSFEVNPNTGGVLGVDRRKRVAQNTLYHDKSRPSHLTMWVAEK